MTTCVFSSVFVIIQVEIGFLKLPRRRKAGDIVLEIILPRFRPAKIMNKNYRLPATVCALAVCLALCFVVVAWVGPSGNPPDSNIAAPINTGGEAQYKTGGLGVKIGGAITYWISQIGNNLVFKTGDDFATAVETVNINTDGRIGNVSAPIDDKDAVNKAYLDAQSGGGAGDGGTCNGSLLSIKFTNAQYNGNLGGVAGADTKCAAEYPGYHFCQYAELKNGGLTGCLPSYSQYWLVSGWYKSIRNDPFDKPSNCGNWGSADRTKRSYLFGNYGWPSFTTFAGGWISEDGGSFGTNYDFCDTLHSLACCKEN